MMITNYVYITTIKTKFKKYQPQDVSSFPNDLLNSADRWEKLLGFYQYIAKNGEN